MRLKDSTENINITRDMDAIMTDVVRRFPTKKLIPYHWPKNKIAKGIAPSTMAFAALAYQVTTEINSVIN